MKKHILISYLYVLSIFSLAAQANMAGINYQALVQDKAGKAVPNAPLKVQIALVAENKSTPAYFSEVHQLTSDFLGQISLVIGQGQASKGKLAEVPWGTEQIWLDIQVEHTNGGTPLNINSHNRLLSVPYALYAATATQLDEAQSALEKTQSIYWTTSGNTGTNPDVHFLGTRDSQSLVVKTNNQATMKFHPIGQTEIIGRGNDNIHPLLVGYGFQGIDIKIEGEATGENNFATFADDSGIWGRIEGQTLDELEADWQYSLEFTKLTEDIAFSLVQSVGYAIKAASLAASIFGIGAAPGTSAISAAYAVELAFLALQKQAFVTHHINNLGVTYQSGAGDYAEWLERAPTERNLLFGEVVGVKGGIVSLSTNDADHVLVVSKNPAVIGNAPSDLSKREHFERIAFMGQVPVKVAGAVSIGDYIIPSGNNDGYGVAVHPQDMQSGDYAQAIGVAWEAAPDHLINYVNVAIGINTNDLSDKVDQLLQNIDNIMAHLEGKEPLLDATQLAQRAEFSPKKPQSTFTKVLSDDLFDRLINQYEKEIKAVASQMQIKLQKSAYARSNDPSTVALLDNPVQALKNLRRDPSLTTQWAMFDKKIAPLLNSTTK